MKRIIIILILIIFPLKVGAISASSYIVMDTDNNRVLEGNNINKESLIASITKILTSMVVINNIDLDKKISLMIFDIIVLIKKQHVSIKSVLFFICILLF